MITSEIESQYSTGQTSERIRDALISAGKDLDHLQPADLEMLEDFHVLGRIATGQLAELAEVCATDNVLDAGSGIGGTARFLASHYGCSVTSIDLTDDYCRTARWLNGLSGLDDLISVYQGDVTDLPFPSGSFQVVVSQHVQMNVADKRALYQQARRVLSSAGRLAIWDITAGSSGGLDYPLPWADRPELSHVVTAAVLRETIESAGFEVVRWSDLTEQAAVVMEELFSMPPASLGLHNFVENFASKARNLIRALGTGRLRVLQGLALAATV